MANFNFEYMGDYLQYKDANGNTLIINGGIINETATGAIAEFTDGADGIPVKQLMVNIEPIQEGTGNPSPDNVRPIRGRTTANIWREATYDTSAEPVISIQLGDTIYGGTVDVINGVMTVNRMTVDLGELMWRYRSDVGEGLFSTTNVNNYKYTPDINAICSALKYDGTVGGIALVTTDKSVCFYYAAGSTERLIYVYDTDYSDAVSFKNAMDGVQLVYELAQPIIVQLTPEQLTTLLGTNYIWSDADSVSVDYVADTKLYIDSKIPATNENRVTVKETIKETENPEIIEVKEI